MATHLKLIIPLMCLFLLCSCGVQKKKENKPVENETEISFEQGEYKYYDEITPDITVENPCVPDKETAIKIAEAVTSGFQAQGYFEDYVTQSVFYDTKNQVWIVTLSPALENYIGACFSLAIKKDNAEVIKMWVGE